MVILSGPCALTEIAELTAAHGGPERRANETALLRHQANPESPDRLGVWPDAEEEVITLQQRLDDLEGL
jgi:hypothetical protein